MLVEGVAKAAVVVDTGIAENGGLSSDLSVADLDGNVDGNSRTMATLSTGSAQIRDYNACKETQAHFFPVE